MCQKKRCIILAFLHYYWFCYENGKQNPKVYLEECKYKIKKIQMSRFINTKLGWDSESDAELMVKLKSDSNNDSE